VIALVAGQSEHALLEDGVAAVPERHGQAEPLPGIAAAAQAVLAPLDISNGGIRGRKFARAWTRVEPRPPRTAEK
jgi:hypothetical protein